MKRFFHNNGKKILAVLGVILMITFFLPSSTRNARSDATANVVATVYDGQKITAGESQQYISEFDELKRLGRKPTADQQQQQQTQSLIAVLGPAARAINNKAFMLLVLEARKAGIVVDTDEYNTFLANDVIDLPTADMPEYDLALAAVHDLLLVNNLLTEVGGFQKISAPEARFALAISQQQVAVNVAQLPLSRYAVSTTEPTTQQVQDQYNKYAKELPGKPTKDNPIGFGYSEPDRVRLQYIGLSRADVRQAAIDKKPAVEWRTLARRFYRQNESLFKPDTQPTTSPTTQLAATMQAATTQPAWEDLTDDMARKVYDHVYDDAANELTGAIIKQISDALDVDWTASRLSTGKATTAPASSIGPAYATEDYLRQLADNISKQYGVRPILGFTGDQLVGAKEIDAIDPFGKAETDQGMKVSQLILNAGEQFTAAQAIPPSSRLTVMQPSPPVSVYGAGYTPTSQFIFRIAEMSPMHAAPLEAVREKVARDVVLQQSWDAASADAKRLIDDAKQRGLLTAATAMTPPVPVFGSGLFSQPNYLDSIPGLTLNPASVAPFANAAEHLLGQVTVTTPHPLSQVDLPAENAVAVLELRETKPTWDTTVGLANQQAEVAYAVQNENEQGIFMDWATYDNVAARTKYKPVERK